MLVSILAQHITLLDHTNQSNLSAQSLWHYRVSLLISKLGEQISKSRGDANELISRLISCNFHVTHSHINGILCMRLIKPTRKTALCMFPLNVICESLFQDILELKLKCALILHFALR